MSTELARNGRRQASSLHRGSSTEEHEVGEQEAERDAGLRDGGVLAALAPRCVLERHHDRAAPFSTEGEALDDRG